MDQAALIDVEVDRSHLPVALIVRISGELDFGTTPKVLSAVEGEPPAGASVIVDLSEVGFCDSSALGLLIMVQQATETAGGRTFLAGAQRQVSSALTVTSLDQLFVMCVDVDAALHEVRTA
ncbi:STAS domain-containing protein [Actinoplanes xinjiangensis]|uniref:STAS domain-containing protein n=1 Tax=Actinoplanes xinjiangensis TaxID=512350 RepID=UPI003443F6E9